MKRYMNTALLYAIFAMAGGVFYREFTKFSGFAEKTALSLVHTHYFMLGMVFFLLLLLLEKSFRFTNAKTGRILAVYHIGLNLTAVMLAVRGVVQVKALAVSSGMNAAISGVAGIGHILTGISMVLLLVYGTEVYELLIWQKGKSMVCLGKMIMLVHSAEGL